MADYSQYQGPNPEWERFTQVAVLPPVGLAPGETLVDYQRSRNALREKDSRAEMETSGRLIRDPVYQQCCCRPGTL
jgi:hypothetical protein